MRKPNCLREDHLNFLAKLYSTDVKIVNGRKVVFSTRQKLQMEFKNLTRFQANSIIDYYSETLKEVQCSIR